MRGDTMKGKSKLLRLFIIFCMTCYVGLTGFLIYQASLNGEESSGQSGAVGDELSGIVNGSAGDQTILIEPTGLEIENAIDKGNVGKTHQLKCKTLPENASYKSLTYASSNSKVASISSSGKIKFLKEGKTEITVANKEYPNISKKFEIDVFKIELIEYSTSIFEGKEKLEPVNDIFELEQYKTYIIDNTFSPKDASVQKVTYTYDKEYLSISNDKITTKKPTSTPIEIKTSCDGKEGSFKISIKEVIIEVVNLESYIANKEKINMNVNQSIKLSSNPFELKFTPENATNKEVSYTSKNSEIVKIEKSSFVAISPGSVEIEIESQDGHIKKVVEIEVKNVIELNEDNPFSVDQEYFSFDEESNTYHIRNGISGMLSCNFTSSTTYKNATFTSNNEKVLLVGNDGTLSPIKVGKAVVTVVIDDGHSTPITKELNFVVEAKPFIEDLHEFYYIVRKSIGHFGAFLVLGIFGTFSFLLILDKKKWIVSIPLNIGLGFGVAALTEYIQTFVPGRYGCWEDIWLDFSGFMTSTILLTIGILLTYLFKHLKNKKKIVG